MWISEGYLRSQAGAAARAKALASLWALGVGGPVAGAGDTGERG